MPVAIPIIATYVGSELALAAGLTAAQAAIVAGAAAAAASLAVASYEQRSAKRKQERALAASRRDLTITLQTADAPHRIVVGRTKVSGPMFYAMSDTSGHQYLFRAVALTGHEIDAYEQVFIGDESVGLGAALPSTGWFSNVVTSTKYTNLAHVEGFVGTSTQPASSLLTTWDVVNWNANRRALGRAYLVVQNNYAPEIYTQGPPNIAAVVRGLKCYDPRTSNVVWTDNPAIIVRQILKMLYGVADAELDDASFTVAANICDEWYQVGFSDWPNPASWQAYFERAASFGLWEQVSGSTYRQRRYRCNGVFTLADDMGAVLADLVESCAGYLSYTGGVWRLVAGSYTAPTMTLTEKDLRGDVMFTPKPPMADLYNEVHGQFVGPMTDYVPTDFPPLPAASFLAEDNNVPLTLPFDLPYTNDAIAAQRIGSIYLYRSRQGVLKFPASLTAMPLRPGDTVMVTLPNLGFNADVFRVEDWAIADDLGIDLVLRECAAGEYTWTPIAAFVDPSPNINLPSPWVVPALTGLTAIDGVAYSLVQNDGSIVQRAKVSWTIVDDATLSKVEIQSRFYDNQTQLEWTNYPAAPDADGYAFLLNVRAGVLHEIRARRINAIGAASPWVTITYYTQQIGPAINLLRNSNWTAELGWGTTGYADARSLRYWTAGGSPAVYARNYQNGQIYNIGSGGCWFYIPSNTVGHYAYIYQDVPVLAQLEYEASVYVNIHRANVILYSQWINNVGAGIEPYAAEAYNSGSAVEGDHYNPMNNRRLWCKGTAPAGTVYARVICLVECTALSSPYPFTAWSNSMLCVAPTGVTRETATPWRPDYVATLDGAVLEAATVTDVVDSQPADIHGSYAVGGLYWTIQPPPTGAHVQWTNTTASTVKVQAFFTANVQSNHGGSVLYPTVQMRVTKQGFSEAYADYARGAWMRMPYTYEPVAFVSVVAIAPGETIYAFITWQGEVFESGHNGETLTMDITNMEMNLQGIRK